MKVLQSFVNTILDILRFINNFISIHNIIMSFIISIIFTVGFMFTYYIYVVENPPHKRKEKIETYTPLAFSMFMMFYKLVSVSLNVNLDTLNIYSKNLLTFIINMTPIFSLFLILWLIFVRAGQFMNFSLFCGWFISIVTFMSVSVSNLLESTSAIWCIVSGVVSLIISGIDFWIASNKGERANVHNRHKVASTSLITFSITYICFMLLLL